MATTPRSTDFVALGHPGNEHYAGLETFAEPGRRRRRAGERRAHRRLPDHGPARPVPADDRLPARRALPRVEVAQALPERASATRARSARRSRSGSATTSPPRSSCRPTGCGSRSSRRPAAASRSRARMSSTRDRRPGRPVRRPLARAAPAPAQREVGEVPARRAAGLGGRDGLRARAPDPRGAARRGLARRHRLRDAAGRLGRRRSPASRPAGSAGRSSPARVRLVADVMSGVAELLRALTAPGDGVVVNPPVYPPFFGIARRRPAGRRGRRSPPVEGWPPRPRRRSSARSPRAPRRTCSATRTTRPAASYERDELEAVAALADALRRHGDLGRGPRADDDAGRDPRPVLSLGDEAAAHVAVTSASKAWNLAGLKCAVIVAGSDAMHDELAERLPPHLALPRGPSSACSPRSPRSSTAASGSTRSSRHLDRNRGLLAELLAEHLPEVRLRAAEAGYLAWLDCRELGLGDDPAEAFLERGRVALSAGPALRRAGARLRAAELRHLAARCSRRRSRGWPPSLPDQLARSRLPSSEHERPPPASRIAAATRRPTCSACPNAVSAASRIFPRIPGAGRLAATTGSRASRASAFAGRPPCVTAWTTSCWRSDGTPRPPSLPFSSLHEPAVDHRAEDRDGEHAAELRGSCSRSRPPCRTARRARS